MFGIYLTNLLKASEFLTNSIKAKIIWKALSNSESSYFIFSWQFPRGEISLEISLH